PPARLAQSASHWSARKSALANIPHMAWIASMRMLLRHFVSKAGLAARAQRGISDVTALNHPLTSARSREASADMGGQSRQLAKILVENSGACSPSSSAL